MRSVISFSDRFGNDIYLNTDRIMTVKQHNSESKSIITVDRNTLYEVKVPCTVIIEKIAEAVTTSEQMGGFVCVSLSN